MSTSKGSAKMRKTVRVDQGYREGYGGPGRHWARVSCDNILLEKFESSSEGDLAVSVFKAGQKWSKDWTPEEWEKATAHKEPASSLCSVCGGDTLDGCSSCVHMTFCKKCRPGIDEFRKKYQDRVDERERASALKAKEDSDGRTMATREALSGAFHWRDGWQFKRLENGAVRVMHPAKMGNGEEYLRTDLVIPPNEWASIVCSVSVAGETGERWNAAQDFHGRRP